MASRRAVTVQSRQKPQAPKAAKQKSSRRKSSALPPGAAARAVSHSPPNPPPPRNHARRRRIRLHLRRPPPTSPSPASASADAVNLMGLEESQKHLLGLNYHELQSLCKQYNLPANKSHSQLASSLALFLEVSYIVCFKFGICI